MLKSLKTTTLSTRLVGLVSFLLIMLIVISAIALLKIDHLKQDVLKIAEEEIPLIRTVAKMTEYQLEQAMRFGQSLQYGQAGIRDKFEEEIQQFQEAGQRLKDVVTEGRKLAQQGLERTQTEQEQKEFTKIKQLLESIEKEHHDYEYHSAEMFQSVAMQMNKAQKTPVKLPELPINPNSNYDCEAQGLSLQQVQTILQHLQLYTKNIDGSWGDGTQAAVKNYQMRLAHLSPTQVLDELTCQQLVQDHNQAFGFEPIPSSAIIATESENKPSLLLTTLETLEKETKHLEENFNELLARVDQLTRTLTDEAKNQQKESFAILIPLALIAIIGGFLMSLFVLSTTVLPLKTAIKTLSDSSEHISVAADQIAATSQYLSDKVIEQATSVEQISASIEQVASLSQRNNATAHQGDTLVKQVYQRVEQADHHLEEMKDSVTGLKHFGGKMSQMMKSLNDTAIQIHLLATNATVEATRSEASQGFAIFTSEIRNLSKKSADTTSEVLERINQSITDIRKNDELTEKSKNDFAHIQQTTEQLTQLMQQMTQDSEQQAHSLKEINTAVDTLEQVTHANAASSEESAAAGNSLNQQAKIMQGVVEELVKLVERRKNS